MVVVYKGRSQENNRTQLDEEDYDIDDESVEENDGGKRRDKGEGIRWEEPRQEELSLKARAHTSTRFASSLCVLWQVTEAILWRLSLSLVMAITSVEGCKDPTPNLITQKAPSLSSSGEVVAGGGLFVPLVGGRRHGKH